MIYPGYFMVGFDPLPHHDNQILIRERFAELQRGVAVTYSKGTADNIPGSTGFWAVGPHILCWVIRDTPPLNSQKITDMWLACHSNLVFRNHIQSVRAFANDHWP